MKKELISLKRKEDICEALLRLMKRKNVQKITIQEIADECGISRYTFYYHFTDIYDCLSWMLQESLRARLREYDDSANWNWEDTVDPIVQNIRENKAIYRHLQNSPNPNLLHHFFHQEASPLVQIYVTRLLQNNQYQATESYMSFLTDFFTSAIEGMMVILVQMDQDCSDEMLKEYLHTIMDGQLEGILQRAEESGFCTKIAEPLPSHAAEPVNAWNKLL